MHQFSLFSLSLSLSLSLHAAPAEARVCQRPDLPVPAVHCLQNQRVVFQEAMYKRSRIEERKAKELKMALGLQVRQAVIPEQIPAHLCKAPFFFHPPAANGATQQRGSPASPLPGP